MIVWNQIYFLILYRRVMWNRAGHTFWVTSLRIFTEQTTLVTSTMGRKRTFQSFPFSEALPAVVSVTQGQPGSGGRRSSWRVVRRAAASCHVTVPTSFTSLPHIPWAFYHFIRSQEAGKHSTMRYTERERRDHIYTTFITIYCYNCSILLFVIGINLFLSPVYKLNLT